MATLVKIRKMDEKDAFKYMILRRCLCYGHSINAESGKTAEETGSKIDKEYTKKELIDIIYAMEVKSLVELKKLHREYVGY